MQRTLRADLKNPDEFAVTVELVLAPTPRGGPVDNAKIIAEDALKDGRVSAVSITDNPGGNPSLSPDVLAREILALGMDVVVHMTCRDLNRAGLESRALALSRMGITNILALTGDYPVSGFGGQGAPVFDLDSVTLLRLLKDVESRVKAQDDDGGFFLGSGVSPFKATEAECFLQYTKLKLKVGGGVQFFVTQLGYDARKFQEVLQMERLLGIERPTLASLYFLMGGAAKAINAGKVPGAVVTRPLLERILAEGGDDKGAKRAAAIERTARLGAIIKGLGYRGVHIGGIHKSFKTFDEILTRMTELEDRWQEFLPEFDLPMADGYYMFEKDPDTTLSTDVPSPRVSRCGLFEKMNLQAMRLAHYLFFRFDAPLAPTYHKLAKLLDSSEAGRRITKAFERPMKELLFDCKDCGDCALQHVSFLCPESQCPKHQRNGPCGGSLEGRCEVWPDRECVWVRCYNRMASIGKTAEIGSEVVPPRLWSCEGASSWLNFHLHRDHQSLPPETMAPFQKDWSKEEPQPKEPETSEPEAADTNPSAATEKDNAPAT